MCILLLAWQLSDLSIWIASLNIFFQLQGHGICILCIVKTSLPHTPDLAIFTHPLNILTLFPGCKKRGEKIKLSLFPRDRSIVQCIRLTFLEGWLNEVLNRKRGVQYQLNEMKLQQFVNIVAGRFTKICT